MIVTVEGTLARPSTTASRPDGTTVAVFTIDGPVPVEARLPLAVHDVVCWVHNPAGTRIEARGRLLYERRDHGTHAFVMDADLVTTK